MTDVRRWRALVVAGAAVAALVAAGHGPQAVAGVTPDQPGVPASGASAANGQAGGSGAAGIMDLPAGTVTLVTGDRVTVVPQAGAAPTISFDEAPRAAGRQSAGYLTQQWGDQLLVVPTDAQPYVDAGVLDRTLFDVGYLLRNGYADSAASRLPLLVKPTPAAARSGLRTAAAALPAATARRELESIGMAAVDIARSGAFWAGIAAVAPRNSSRLAVAPSLGHGIAKVLLDRKVTATLDESVPLVGAPQAWAAGYDGRGVKVAVLDTGIDATHPDLAGKVVAAQDFTRSASGTADKQGHGTHVASTIVGQGTASGGRYKGVAPGADLLIGKVLGDNGSGATSGIIDGMEWAAAQGAKVISMSLGATSNGAVDPMTEALDRLTASSGALFVVAAGNSGPEAGTVGTPGVAATALTVANTTKTDQIAPNSSRGPLLSAERVAKPDLAAPGTAIAAARAAGTALGPIVDEHYTRISGTSMATPHVAGAVAILAQQHPDWSPERLKSTLMSTGKDAGLTAYEQGAGRLDVARAVGQQVGSLTTGLDLGRSATGVDAVLTRPVTYTNDGGQPVTLALTTGLRTTNGTDASAAIAAPAEVTVPAHGTATIDVSVSPAGLGEASYTGALVATAGDTVVRTVVAMVRGPELHRVPVTMKLPRPSGEVNPVVYAFDLERGTKPLEGRLTAIGADGVSATGSIVLPAGRWALRGRYEWSDPAEGPNMAWITNPEVVVDGSTEVVLDGRDLHKVELSAEKPAETVFQHTNLMRVAVNGGTFSGGTYTDRATGLWYNATEPVRTGRLVLNTEATLITPQLEITAGDVSVRPRYYRYYGNSAWFRSATRVPVVDIGETLETAELAQVRGAVVLFSGLTGGCRLSQQMAAALTDAGAAGVLQTSAICQALFHFPWGSALSGDLPAASIRVDDAERLRAALVGGSAVSVRSTPEPREVRHLAVIHEQRIPPGLTRTVRDSELARTRTTFSADRAGRANFFVGTAVPATQQFVAFASNIVTTVPSSRDELYGPIRPGVFWSRVFQAEFQGAIGRTSRVTTLRPGRMPAETWGAAPRGIGPAALPAGSAGFSPNAWCFACRDGDTLYVAPMTNEPDPAVISGDPAQIVSPYAIDGPAGTTRLWKGTEEIPMKPFLGRFPTFQLPAGPGRYRLSSDWTRAKGVFGTRFRTDWTFGSTRPSGPSLSGQRCLTSWGDPLNHPCSVQQLLHLRYSTGVDATNRAARGPAVLRITPYYEPSPTAPRVRLRSIKVWTSTDDGATWQRAVVGGGSAAGVAVFRTPLSGPADQAVSLKVEAVDAAGNTVTQVLDRAYGLRPGR